MIRYQPEIPFPENRVFPDVKGLKDSIFSLDNLSQNKYYLYALDLFNHGYFWEAHEIFEYFWHYNQRKGEKAEFFKILIKICAAGVKFQEKNARGKKIHLTNALNLLPIWQEKYKLEVFAGINLAALAKNLENLQKKEDSFWQIQLTLV